MLNHELVPRGAMGGWEHTVLAPCGPVPGEAAGRNHRNPAPGPRSPRCWPLDYVPVAVAVSGDHRLLQVRFTAQGRLRAGRRHLQAPREHRGKVAAPGASLQQGSSVLPLCLLAKLGTQSEPELGSAAFGLISPVTPSQGL